MTKTCNNCSKVYEIERYRIARNKYCGSSCHNSVAGKAGGKAGKGVSRNVGVKRPDLAARNKINPRKGAQTANWKGSQAGYASLHQWLYRYFGKPTACEHCPSSSKIQWANKDKTYKRDISNWLQLCTPCHRAHDKQLKDKPFPFDKINRSIRLTTYDI